MSNDVLCGTIKVYHNEFSGKKEDEGREALDALVVVTNREGDEISFKVLSVSNDNGYFHTKVIPGQHFTLSSRTEDIYHFEEACGDEKDRLVKMFNEMKLAEENAPWKFSGRMYEKNSFGELAPVKGIEVVLKGPKPKNLDEATRMAYERHPMYFFGGSIWKDFVAGDFSLNAVPSYYMEIYKTDDQLEALLSYGKEKGFDTSLVEELMEARDAGELER